MSLSRRRKDRRLREGIGENGKKFYFTLNMDGARPQPDVSAQIKIAKDLAQICACGCKKISHYGKTRLGRCWYSERCNCPRFKKAIAPLVSG